MIHLKLLLHSAMKQPDAASQQSEPTADEKKMQMRRAIADRVKQELMGKK